jgi:hypothetical protein
MSVQSGLLLKKENHYKSVRRNEEKGLQGINEEMTDELI